MSINAVIQKHQDEIIKAINRAGAELPPKIVQLILQNALYQIDAQVGAAIRTEGAAKEQGGEDDGP
jgi:hypothetical protein